MRLTYQNYQPIMHSIVALARLSKLLPEFYSLKSNHPATCLSQFQESDTKFLRQLLLIQTSSSISLWTIPSLPQQQHRFELETPYQLCQASLWIIMVTRYPMA